jgi:hypothetical protein
MTRGIALAQGRGVMKPSEGTGAEKPRSKHTPWGAAVGTKQSFLPLFFGVNY